MSRKLRNIKPRKVNRGAFEERNQREENRTQNQRALLFILPLVMLAVLAIGIFFGYKFYLDSVNEISPISPSEPVSDDASAHDPMLFCMVNSAYPLEEDYVPQTTESCGVPVAAEAAEHLEQMITDAEKDGVKLHVVEGYISYADLQTRYENAVKKYRKESKASLVMAEVQVKKKYPPAGENEQQTGLLVYLTAEGEADFADSDAYAWLLRNGVDYGFVLRYPEHENVGGVSYSPHLFRYIGKEYAYHMRELNMNFDEYIVYLDAK